MKKCLIVTTLVAALIASIVSIRTFTAGKAVILKRQAELVAVNPPLSANVKTVPKLLHFELRLHPRLAKTVQVQQFNP
jgi:hypothetical protein